MSNMPAWFGWDWIEQNIIWSLIWSAVPSIMATAAVRKSLDMLTDNKKMIWFFVCSWLAVFSLTILFGHGQVAEKPNLKAHIDSLMWGGTSSWAGISNPPDQLKSPIFTVVSIRNTGAMDSIADGYKLILRLGGRTYTGELESLGKADRFALHANGLCATYYGEDSLLQKTINNPIQVGASVTGIMIFTFKNLDKDALKEEDYLDITLQFGDVNGDMHSISEKRLARNPSSLSIPGIRQDVCSS